MTNQIALPPPAESPVEPALRPKSSEHLPALDGARGLAILLVLLIHLSAILRSNVFLNQVFSVGWIGVDLFFVLSGFLITRILVSTQNDSRYYSRFYIRRGLRIWPLYFTYVLFFYFGLHFVSQFGAVQRFAATSEFLRENPLRLSRPLIVYLLFIQNLVGFSDVLGITWSLCIEEHFYLIWPMLVRKFSVGMLKKILWTAFWLSPVVRMGYFFFSRYRGTSFKLTYAVMYHSTPFHLDPIIAGCLLGLHWIEWKQPERFRRLFFQMLVGGVVVFPVVWLLTQRESFVCCFAYTVLSILFTGLVGLALLGWSRRFFVNPGLRYSGKISFGFYLLHEPIVSVFQSHPILHRLFPFKNVFLMEVAGAICATVLSFVVAILSWKLFEKPILSLKDRLAP